MFQKQKVEITGAALRLMTAVGAAGLMAGCADSSRLSDPFTDPFGGSRTVSLSKTVDQSPTGAIEDPAKRRPVSTAVESRPLPAPAPVTAAATSAPQQTAALSSAAPASIPTPAPGADPHWTANGGTPIVVAQGESAAILATRYGVPTDALVKSNGFTSAAQVQPGARLIVPVYRAVATAKAAPVVTPAAAPAAAPAPVASATAVKTVTMTKAEKRAQQQEELAAAREKAVAKEAERKAALAKTAEEKRLRIEAERQAKAQKQAEAKMLRQADAKTTATKVAAVEATAPAAPAAAPAAKTAPAPAPARVASNVDNTPTAAIPPDAATKPIPAEEGPEFRWPARGRVIQGFSSGGNDGINIAVPEGTQVKAAENGEVAYAGSELKGYGNMVLIRHEGGYVTAYAHNGELQVRKGDKVKRGQTIAKSGQTGNVSSPQLHFELRKGQTPIDPTRYLAGL